MQLICCSGGDEPVPEGERARGAEGHDASAAAQAVRGVQGDCEPTAHARPYRRPSAARESVNGPGQGRGECDWRELGAAERIRSSVLRTRQFR